MTTWRRRCFQLHFSLATSGVYYLSFLMIILLFIWLSFFILNSELRRRKREGNKFLTPIWVRISFQISANSHAQVSPGWLGLSASKNPEPRDRNVSTDSGSPHGNCRPTKCHWVFTRGLFFSIWGLKTVFLPRWMEFVISFPCYLVSDCTLLCGPIVWETLWFPGAHVS